jgi:hypothetical protein
MKNVSQIIITTSVVILTASVLYLVNLERLKNLPQNKIQQIEQQYVLNTELTVMMTGTQEDLADVASPTNVEKFIEVTCKVKIDATTSKYVYNYKLKYNGTKNIFLVWDTLDKIIDGDNNPALNPYLIELSPDKTYEFHAESDYPPTTYASFALFYNKNSAMPCWTANALSVQPTPIPMSSKNFDL